MARAMDAVVDIDTRVVAAVRWRGGTETAVNMIMGGAVTTDAVLAQQYDARVKEIVGDINKIQETIVAGATAPEEKATIDKVVAERKLVLEAVAKTWELKGAGDAVETQRFADEQLTPWWRATSRRKTNSSPSWNAAVRWCAKRPLPSASVPA